MGSGPWHPHRNHLSLSSTQMPVVQSSAQADVVRSRRDVLTVVRLTGLVMNVAHELTPKQGQYLAFIYY